jgi:cytoskeleton protein RodZ
MGTLGERLRARRQELGYGLGEISQKLKIRLAVLQALEEGNLTYLPAVYMRAFARDYGVFLGIPPQELQQLLDAAFGKVPTRGSSVPAAGTSVRVSMGVEQFRTTLAHALIYGALAGAAVAVVYYFLLRPTPSEQLQRSTEVVVRPDTGMPQWLAPAGQPAQPDTLMRLRARARDTVWLSVVVDGRRSGELVLYPGQERLWEARSYVLLSVGNAGGIELWRNEEPLPPLGPVGKVVRSVRITPTGLTTSLALRDSLPERARRVQPETTPPILPAPVLTPVTQPRPEPVPQ